jgi:hypothetical protein
VAKCVAPVSEKMPCRDGLVHRQCQPTIPVLGGQNHYRQICYLVLPKKTDAKIPRRLGHLKYDSLEDLFRCDTGGLGGRMT